MKRLFTAFALAAFCTAGVNAQLANGFYHVQNMLTGRYISISDNDPNNYTINVKAGTVNMAGLRTIKSWETVSTSPATVIYVKNISGNNYDLQGQGTSLYKMSGNKLYIILTPSSGGYQAKTSNYSGISLTIADGTDPDKAEDFLRNKSKEASYWKPKAINTSDEYVCIQPDVTTNDGYYATVYASFAFTLSSGMTAYYVTAAGGNSFTMKQITGTVPAATPVIIKCPSASASGNKIMPVVDNTAAPGGNMLNGVYCALTTVNKHFNAKVYDSSSMRVIGTHNGKLAFVKASASDLVDGKYLKANKAYLTVTGAGDVLTEGGTGIVNMKAEESENESLKGIYTLTGVRIPDGVTPKAGIYIKDGKKMIIK